MPYLCTYFGAPFFPPASAVEGIKSVPSVCVCVCVCLSVSALMIEPFELQA